MHVCELQRRDSERIGKAAGEEEHSKAKQAVCVYAERQMVFYNRSSVASGKEIERQRLITPWCKCSMNGFCIVQR